MSKIKVRTKNAYWGNFFYVGDMMDGSRVSLDNSDFEEYIESKHGWHNSEEWIKNKTLPYQDQSLDNFAKHNPEEFLK